MVRSFQVPRGFQGYLLCTGKEAEGTREGSHSKTKKNNKEGDSELESMIAPSPIEDDALWVDGRRQKGLVLLNRDSKNAKHHRTLYRHLFWCTCRKRDISGEGVVLGYVVPCVFILLSTVASLYLSSVTRSHEGCYCLAHIPFQMHFRDKNK